MVDKVDRSNKYEPKNVEEVKKVIKDGVVGGAGGDIRNHRRASIASQKFTSCIISPWLFMREPPR